MERGGIPPVRSRPPRRVPQRRSGAADRLPAPQRLAAAPGAAPAAQAGRTVAAIPRRGRAFPVAFLRRAADGLTGDSGARAAAAALSISEFASVSMDADSRTMDAVTAGGAGMANGTEKGPAVRGFFDQATNTVSYLVADPETNAAAVIDSVLDFEPRSGRISTASADNVLRAATGLKIEWILETHCHADHLTAAMHIREHCGGKLGIGAHIVDVQRTWKEIYNLEPGFAVDGSQFDHLFQDAERFKIGNLHAVAWSTPGHTPSCMTYIVRGATG